MRGSASRIRRRAAAALSGALALAGLPGAVAAELSLIPLPASVTARDGQFLLRPDTAVYSTDAPSADIARYFTELLRTTHGMALAAHPLPKRGVAGHAVPAHAILFRLDPQASADGPESYQVEVSRSGVLVSAPEPHGLFYGAVTLWQLCGAPVLHAPIELPAILVRDAPRFRWRGLMLDSARHFQTPDFLFRYIDWMALHKLNVLGWHLTDDQGWRLAIRKYPRLTEVGAWRVPAGAAAQRDIDPATGRPRLYGGFYTQEDVRRIVAHARERFITIVPEIGMPGHATAAIVAYPQLGVTDRPPLAVPADWGVFPNLYNVEESTFAFLEDVLAEVMELFPSEFVHIGGDEAVKDQWKASARIQARMRELGVADEAALQGYFTARMGKYLAAHGRRLIGWDEILEGGVPADAAVMSWRGVEGATAAAASGHDAVLSPAPTLYLDHRQGSGPNQPPGRGQVVSLERVYAFDPLPGPVVSAAAHLLGVQANLWTEHVRTEERAAYMTWPRAAALAEIGWSPPQRRDFGDFKRRLPVQFDRYRALGIGFSADVFAPARTLGVRDRHMSQDLATCTDKLVLNLEDDAPLAGPRAVFLIDIENPCWKMPTADLSGLRRLTAAVGQVPFNFQIGRDIEAIRFRPPRSPAGELEVRVDGCEGSPVAVLPLAPAAGHDDVTVLPAATLPALEGQHALCFTFTQHSLDPLWALDWVQLAP
ncbi:MAG: family 20 glycosylhydrolase [Gammaproteobacteria bacterium]|nr:family 20 glycosylhydrolase [Gammaproteobacteria bacterium]